MVATLVKYVLCAFLGACILVFSSQVSAQDKELARSEYQLGWKALRAKEFAKALEHYQRSYSEVSRPRTMYNIALCEEATANYEAAVAHYQQFLIEAEARDKDFLVLARAKLKALRTRIGAILRIDSDPTGASVSIDGKLKGHTPLRLDLLEGEHIILIRHRGTRASEREIKIRAGQDVSEFFTLEAVGSVSITVTPQDAIIRRVEDLDESVRGFYQAKLSPGRYKFEISLMGYHSVTFSVPVDASTNVKREVRLKAKSSTGVVSFRSDLNGASVTIDGLVVGSLRRREGEEVPTLERRLTVGNHVMIVEARGEQSWSKRFHLAAGETIAIDLKFKNVSATRKYTRWTLNGVGAVALVAGLTLGALAIRDVRSDDDARYKRGKDRAGNADILIGLGAIALAGSWYLDKCHTVATMERTREEESTTADSDAESHPMREPLLPEQRLWIYGLPHAADSQANL